MINPLGGGFTMTTSGKVNRQTVDLSGFPDLVVIYLGMRVNRLRGLRRFASLGPQINKSWKDKPEGLLLHENIIFSIIPMHAGMRQYWKDLDTLERWTRSEPHQRWWKDFLKDTGGTGFWHETYLMGGGMEAVYDEMDAPIGFARFAPTVPARGPMFSARKRAGRNEPLVADPVVPEDVYYP
jgi:hypothetical protein